MLNSSSPRKPRGLQGSREINCLPPGAKCRMRHRMLGRGGVPGDARLVSIPVRAADEQDPDAEVFLVPANPHGRAFGLASVGTTSGAATGDARGGYAAHGAFLRPL